MDIISAIKIYQIIALRKDSIQLKQNLYEGKNIFMNRKKRQVPLLMLCLKTGIKIGNKRNKILRKTFNFNVIDL